MFYIIHCKQFVVFVLGLVLTDYFFFKVNGIDLLNIPAYDANSYGRGLLDVSFTKEEQKNSIVLKSHKSQKPPLDPECVQKLLGKLTNLMVIAGHLSITARGLHSNRSPL